MGSNHGAKRGKTYIDVNDIVGKTFGAYRVIKYNGVRKSPKCGRQVNVPYHMYEVECIECGKRSEAVRGSIISCKFKSCKSCYIKNHVQHYVDEKRKSSVPYSNNSSTGIKRYSISKKYKCCEHVVSCTVDGKRYYYFREYVETSDLLPDAVSIANELNQVLSAGKEYFYEWNKNFCENQNNC